MRRVVLCALLCSVVLSGAAVLPERAVVSAADDPLSALDEAEKDYVNRMRGAYSAARAALDQLSGQLDDAALGAIFGGGPGALDIAGYVATCNSRLSGAAGPFHESPPSSMSGLASAHDVIASRLEGSFSSCAGIAAEEGVNYVLNEGRRWLGGLLGPPAEEQSMTALKAKLFACMKGEIDTIRTLLDAGEAALDARIQELKEEQELGASIIESFMDECFIATAAYGTPSAEEIDVLRDFRDRVLTRSDAGRDLIGFYYAASPPLAGFISRHELLRVFVRECLVDPVVWCASLLQPAW
jgi:hypothetical protein